MSPPWNLLKKPFLGAAKFTIASKESREELERKRGVRYIMLGTMKIKKDIGVGEGFKIVRYSFAKADKDGMGSGEDWEAMVKDARKDAAFRIAVMGDLDEESEESDCRLI
jgi:hypothetical protein